MALTSNDQRRLTELSNAWNSARTQADRDRLHNEANAIRDRAGVSDQYDRTTGARLSSRPATSSGASSVTNRYYSGSVGSSRFASGPSASSQPPVTPTGQMRYQYGSPVKFTGLKDNVGEFQSKFNPTNFKYTGTYQPVYQYQEFQKPQYTALNMDQANQQAGQQVNPLYVQALENIRKAKYQNELNAGELASSRGLAHSGLAADLQNKVALQAQQDTSNMETEKAAKVAALAQQLLQQDQQRQDQLTRDAFNQWMSQQQLGMQRNQEAYNQYQNNYEQSFREWAANQDQGWKQNEQAYREWTQRKEDDYRTQMADWQRKLDEALQTGRWYLD